MDAPDSELPLEQQEEIDRLADQFEREFKAGDNPRIEDYLKQQPDLRAHLLKELIALEIELRRAAGQQLDVEQYHQRFPDDRDIVAAVLSPSPTNEELDADSIATISSPLTAKKGDDLIVGSSPKIARFGFGGGNTSRGGLGTGGCVIALPII